MSEESAEAPAEVPDDIVDAPDDETESEAPEEQPDLASELERWKANSRKNERRARENAAAAKELAEIKKAGMSDAERLQAELAEATRERDEARTTHNRVMAAAAHDLPVELIDYIPSGTEDEMNDHAETIARVIQETATQLASQMVANQQGRNGFAAARPVESMRAGSAPAGEQTPQTPDQWFRHLLDNR